MKPKEPTRRSSRISKNTEESLNAGRKKRNSTADGTSSKIRKKADGGRRTDDYCWVCHHLGHDIGCSSCPRVYHCNCVIKEELKFNASNSCGECQAQYVSTGDKIPNIQKYSLTQLLEIVVQKTLKEDVKKNNHRSQSQASGRKFWKYFEMLPEEDRLCQIIDLSFLIDKMKKRHYLTTAEFFSDVKWIYHNCYILHGADSEITETALKMEKCFKTQLLDVEACGECYINNANQHGDFFTRVCVGVYYRMGSLQEESFVVKGTVHTTLTARSARVMTAYSVSHRNYQHGPVAGYMTRTRLPFGHACVTGNKFFNLCDEEPHEIIWAKLRGSPYWPAKLMRINKGYADVIFFGTHDKSCIPLSQCFRISHRSPNDKDIKQVTYRQSISELSVYFSNFQATDHNVIYYPYRTPLVDSVITGPKKSHKRGWHRRSQSEKQLNVSSLSEGMSVTNELDKVVKGDQIGLDTSLQHSPADSSLHPNNCEIECAEMASERNKSEPVAVCMTFTTDDETGPDNQISMASNLINVSAVETSVPMEYSTPIVNCSPVIVENPDFLHSTDDLVQTKLNSCEETTLQNSSPHFINSESDKLLPVITSVSAEASLNTTFASDETVSFSNESLKSEASNVLPKLGINSENSYVCNRLSEQGKEFVDNTMVIDNDDDDDDDVIYDGESPPKESKAVNAVLNNSGVAHALSQILSSNRPHLQDLYKRCLDFGLKSFLQIWLSSTIKRHDENDVLMFLEVYNKVSKANELLKEENLSLQEEKKYFVREKASMNHEKSSIKQEQEFIKLEKEYIQKEKDFIECERKSIEQHKASLKEKILEMNLMNLRLQRDLDASMMREHNIGRVKTYLTVNTVRLEHDTIEMNAVHSYLKENSALKEKLCEAENNLLEKEAELNKYKEGILQLEDELKSALEKPSCTSSECQTCLSDGPDNEMFTLKELEDFKQACQEQISSRHIEPTEAEDLSSSSRAGEFEIVTRRTVTQTRTSSIIAINEDDDCPLNPGNPQIFGNNATFYMEYANGQPITVVSSPFPPPMPPMLMTDYGAQQSNVGPTNSASRRNRSKKREKDRYSTHHRH